ncbi:C4-dicarboxylate-binding protein DctP [Cytobacillus horneckiae]|uniref:C4-dicarboxylate ABC transporter substrate-binding protein n=1 Tax=Cytobacillus horneckiae TaxID=549687 RepID=A0A2N0Z8N1_9BACI|nr:DctP family TRAP transporter solute-binding subunit [Cytobacillus horneckiae]MBN6886198.1 DctP family TRAP transporter solute-binding subunit [Cytobacillus horneckiae]MCM3176497.1 DctP family TRAP transporter solute-binding subunit [Cytobacillus horneckiae]MEC1157686.1 DctP family TRAP transporter solute-binding subunit [Cytobacillus horneckiae]MED2940745.1 DctP family TRAP transporter solute-binding subunit [Cytobacillus horneckiae]PKG25864.1 C4-dicarboxylate ABC transporter substrate-bind
MKKRLAVVVLVIAMFIISACGRPSGANNEEGGSDDGDSQYTLRVAYLVPEEQSTHIAALNFKKKIEEDTEGKIKVQLYPNGSLYASDREAIEAVQLGNIEMTIPAVAPLASFNKKFMVFDLPFLFSTNEAAYKALDGELGQSLLDDLSNNDLKGLVFAENGFRNISNNNGPVESPGDLQGIKFRTLENPVHTDTFKAFGANASPFAFGELYTALQQKTYDAMENPISLFYTNKFYEVQDYLTLSGHVYAATILVMNNDFYNNLPENLQKVVDEASVEYREQQRELAHQQDEEFLQKIKDNGTKVNELTAEQKQAFRDAAQPVYDKYVPEIGEDLVKQALEANK